MNEVEDKSKKLFKAGLVVLGIGIVIPFLGLGLSTVIVSAFFSAATAIFVIGIMFHFHAKKGDRLVRDERTNRIALKAAWWSWILPFGFITILFWVQYLKLYALTVDSVLAAMFYFLVASNLVSRWIINRSPNV